MSKKINVQVTDQHIIEGEPENMHCCAIALATVDALRDNKLWSEDYVICVENDATIHVRYDSEGDYEDVFYFELNDDDAITCERFIERFDNFEGSYDDLNSFEFDAKIRTVKYGD